jgi:hypothetical protein
MLELNNDPGRSTLPYHGITDKWLGCEKENRESEPEPNSGRSQLLFSAARLFGTASGSSSL